MSSLLDRARHAFDQAAHPILSSLLVIPSGMGTGLSGLSGFSGLSGSLVSLVFRSANHMSETSGTWGLVCLVYLVYLVCLVGRIGRPTRRTKETRQVEQTGLRIPVASQRFQKCRDRGILRSAVPVVIIPRRSFVTTDIRGNIDELAMPVPEGSG